MTHSKGVGYGVDEIAPGVHLHRSVALLVSCMRRGGPRLQDALLCVESIVLSLPVTERSISINQSTTFPHYQRFFFLLSIHSLCLSFYPIKGFFLVCEGGIT